MIDLSWRKSSRSNTQAGACVEVARDRGLLIRDSKQPNGSRLAFDATSWTAFLDDIKRGRYDL